jgi:hypothetical protein
MQYLVDKEIMRFLHNSGRKLEEFIPPKRSRGKAVYSNNYLFTIMLMLRYQGWRGEERRGGVGEERGGEKRGGNGEEGREWGGGEEKNGERRMGRRGREGEGMGRRGGVR